jgi:acetyltransferase-like isoleucine patch superfamily enzyme
MIRRLGSKLRATELGYWRARARLEFLVRGISWPGGLVIKGPIGLSVQGEIRLGRDVTIVSDSKFNRAGVNHPTQLAVEMGGLLEIGDRVGMTGAAIYCAERITIGNDVLIGANCRIYDTDFHPVDFQERRSGARPKTAPVAIGNDVWLGAGATVLKGVTSGDRTVVAAGAVVVADLPSDVVAGGVPAKLIRTLTQ